MSKVSRRGMILVDAILALTLGTIFIAFIVESSLDSRNVLNRAINHRNSIDTFAWQKVSFQNMAPYESRVISSSSAYAEWYGNDRIETNIKVGATNTDAYIPFNSVSLYPFQNLKDAEGTPLCSVDFGYTTHSAVSIAPVYMPISAGIPLTSLQVRDGIAYISGDSSLSSDPDIFVVDIHDPVHPSLVSSINTGPGISAITLAGQRIYAAANSTAAELHIIRLDSLDHPVLEEKFKLPLPYATATAPFADSIFYDKGKIYLGTEKWDGEEFSIIDVSTSINPLKIGGFEIGNKVSSLYARSDKAYVASANQNQLQVLDVKDPHHVSRIAAFSPSGWQRQEGEIINFFEDSFQLGRTSGGFDILTDYEGFAWATTSSTTLSQFQSINDPGGIYGIIRDRSDIFWGTRQVGKELKITDLSLSAPSVTSYPLPASIQAMTCDGDSIYVLGHTQPVIYKIAFYPHE